jgi:hypothetical protein
VEAHHLEPYPESNPRAVEAAPVAAEALPRTTDVYFTAIGANSLAKKVESRVILTRRPWRLPL